MLARKHAAALLSLFFVVACGVSTQAVRIGIATERPPFRPEVIVFYRTPDQVPGEYEEVAKLRSKGNYAYTDDEDMYASIRKRAAALGANAVLLRTVKEPDTAARISYVLIGSPANRRVEALAIFIHPANPTSVRSPSDGW